MAASDPNATKPSEAGSATLPLKPRSRLQSARRDRLTLGRLLRPHSKQIALGFAAVVGESIANLLQPWPLKIVLDGVLKSKSSSVAALALVHRFVGSGNMAVLYVACAAVLAIALFDAVCSYTEKYLTTSIGQWIAHDLRRFLYSHIQQLSLGFYNEQRTGDLISRVTDDSDAVQSFITSALLGAVVDLLTLLGMIGVMFYLNWQFTLIALSVTPALLFITYSYTRRIKKASRNVRKKQSEIVSVVEEALTSARIVKAFAREDYELERMEERSLASVEAALEARSIKAKLSPLVQIITAVGTGLVLWFGARLVLQGHLSTGSLIVFLAYLKEMYKPMQDLSKLTDTYSKAAVGYERINEVLSEKTQVPDSRGARKAPRFKGDIEFEHVTFGYDDDQCILNDVSFHIKAGEMVAIVGPTGAGKTTILSLLARFYDPSEGIIRIDGTDVRRFKQESLRNQISWVLQETVLFYASVWQNIAYGKPEASREEIIRAAELANASEFIDKLPDGYDTIIGERGMTLSGGQRQRIAIARAIIRNSPILVLDEPTSGLDVESEKLVFEALDRLMEGKTCIVIAHRLSTVRRANNIFVLKDGAIVEQGTHDKLCEMGGVYAHLNEIQQQASSEAEPSKSA